MNILFKNNAGRVYEEDDGGVSLDVELGKDSNNDDIIELTRKLAFYSISDEMKEMMTPKEQKKYINQIALQMLSDTNMIKNLPENQSGEIKGKVDFEFGGDDEENKEDFMG